ncbi:hypothetical protein Nepgr_010977, partial [Nepenthes gracilis]
MTKSSKPWRPIAASSCCSIEDSIILGIKCKRNRSDFSKNIAPLPSFRRLPYSDHLSNLISCSSQRITEDLAHSFGPDLYDFQLNELRAITHNFSSNFLLGGGGFGKVHKGFIDESLRAGLKAQAVAVKHLDNEGLQGHREWLRNSSHARDSEMAGPPASREDFTVKLSDFGLAKIGPEGSNTHVTTRVMGTYGYAAPEYISTGHLTTRSDVYSFGVVLLELMTGKRSMDKTRPKGQQNLVDWARPYLTSCRRLHYIMDSRLAGQYSVKGAKEMALLALKCVSLNPKDRPLMPVVVETLEGLQQYKDMAVACG